MPELVRDVLPHDPISKTARALATQHSAPRRSHRAHPGRDVRLTTASLALTLVAASLSVADILTVLATRARSGRWEAVLPQVVFFLIVAYLIYGACVYHVARLGYLRRLAAHVPASDKALASVYSEADPPLLTVLVPSYMEEERVIRRTLLCGALQTYPRRRVVLLIDDPPQPPTPCDAARLHAARRLPRDIEHLLARPRRLCAGALDAFLERRAAGRLDTARERLTLARLQAEVASWLEKRADEYEILDHADELLVETIFRAPARACREESARLSAAAAEAGRPDFQAAYRRLLAPFDVELTSFERKRYDNLSHEPNKAMNLNSYIALLGGTFREVAHDGRLTLVRASAAPALVRVPPSDFLLVVDADSILTHDYALRLVHVLREPGHEKVAIVQTPYSAFPGAPGALERVAGATTDMQYIVHQGFTRYGAAYWVGANAVVRTAALADIATHATERGYPITRFVHDRTLIEDTESTVDLLAHGWRLHNYPERLAYSETPRDFGALLIQRRRWANGGLIILPKLLRHLTSPRADRTLWQALMMTHYLTSLAAVNIGLLLVLAFSFEDSIRSAWLPLTALPYYSLYARDLRLIGYRARDVLRVYALNLILIPVNLVGVVGSLYQAVTGTKAAFGRTPKSLGHTPVPVIYLCAELAIAVQWLLRGFTDVLEERPLHALLAAANLGFLVYGCLTFMANRGDGRSLPLRSPRRRPRARERAGSYTWVGAPRVSGTGHPSFSTSNGDAAV